MQQLFESIISFSRNKVFKNGGKIAVVATMLFVCGFFINTASAATSGPNFAGSGTNVAGIGTYAWTVPANIVSNNNVYATVDLPGGGTATSNYVAGRSYGFAIPTNATINGIQVVVGRYTSGTSDPLIRDHVVSLVKGGVITGDNKAVTGTNWPTTEGAATYGSVSDLWGTSWTPADINSANFGVDLSAINTNATPARNRTASVDYIQVIVTYTVDTVAPVIAPHSTVTATADALGSGHVIYTAPAVTDNVVFPVTIFNVDGKRLIGIV